MNMHLQGILADMNHVSQSLNKENLKKKASDKIYVVRMSKTANDT